MIPIAERLEASLKEKKVPPKVHDIFKELYLSFCHALRDDPQTMQKHEVYFHQLLDLVEKQVAHPHPFGSVHKRTTQPFDYTTFGVEFLRPLVSSTHVDGMEQVEQMQTQLTRGENVVLFGNHQTEIDPQMLHVALETAYPELAAEIIFVAGDRVLTDALAVPFSLGRNLICIYSKRHIDHPPEKKSEKQQHNQKTMKKMREMLAQGGQCIYVAPSGGRDRPGPDGTVDVAPFDSASIEMFRLMAMQSGTPTHFYPLALATYAILPPPDNIESELGETRRGQRAPALLAFGKEIDMEHFPGYDTKDRRARREALANHIWNLVRQDYHKLKQ